MIIYLYGSDTFRSRRQLRDMIAKFKKDRDPQGLNVVRLDVEKQADQVLQEVLAAPFLAERRMVVLENLLISKNKELLAEMARRVEEENLPESNVIVFWEGTDKFRTKAAKAFSARLQKEKFAQSFDALSGATLSKWIVQEGQDRGGTMDRQAVQYLATHVGSDMWRLSSSIDQLIAYKNGGTISVDDVRLFLDERADDNIFNLVDAIVAKNPKQVFQMIEEQYKNGEDAHYILAMLQRQFRILLQLKDVFDRGQEIQSAALAKKLDLHPFVVKKSLPLVKRYAMEELERVYRQLLDIDIKTKTGQGDQSMMLDFFVGKVTSS